MRVITTPNDGLVLWGDCIIASIFMRTRELTFNKLMFNSTANTMLKLLNDELLTRKMLEYIAFCFSNLFSGLNMCEE